MIYSMSRGEQQIDNMQVDGEIRLQREAVRLLGNEKFIAFDIGANQGEWTQTLVAGVSSKERHIDAHVFEPIPDTFERLKAIVGQPGKGRAYLNAIALSDRSGAAEMVIMSDTGGTNSLVFDPALKHGKAVVSVPLSTLDEYAAGANIDRIHLIKCDAEGHDLAIIKGAHGMLSRGQIDLFQFEYNHRWIEARSFLKDVFDLCASLPYSIGRIMPDGIEILEEWHPELERYFQSNYVLLRKEVAGAFLSKSGKIGPANTFVETI